MPPNLIDIEASGLAIDSYPIEIALSINAKIHSWLIKPDHRWQYWDNTAERLHGITRDTLLANGIEPNLVVDAIDRVMATSNGLLYSDAAAWDADWMATLYHAVGTIPNFHILPVDDLLSDNQQTLFWKKRNEVADSGQYRLHRAEQDVRILQEALRFAMETK